MADANETHLGDGSWAAEIASDVHARLQARCPGMLVLDMSARLGAEAVHVDAVMVSEKTAQEMARAGVTMAQVRALLAETDDVSRALDQ